MCSPVCTLSLQHLSHGLQKLQVASHSFFISLVQDRPIPETSSALVGQEAHMCACTRTEAHTPVTWSLLMLRGPSQLEQILFFWVLLWLPNHLHETSEPEICCCLNFPVDISTDFSAYSLDPYLSWASAAFLSFAVPGRFVSHFPV